MKPTIKDVARQSGVSVATVSRILNGLQGFSPETRARVEASIAELGYRPNAVARGLVNQSTGIIGVLLPCVTDKFATLLLQGIEDGARERGYSVIVCNTESNGNRTMEYLRVLEEQRVDGIVFASEWITDDYGRELRAMKVPVVLTATMSMKFPFPYVKVDDRLAAYSATRYLLDKGHRNIALLSGSPSDRIAGTPRIEGWRQALEEAGLPVEERMVAYGDFHFASGIAGAETLSGSYPEATAVFATSDEMALGVLSWAYRKGMPIPSGLSVLGYDDTLAAEMAIPPLSSVRQPIYEMGRTASELLFEGEAGRSIVMPFGITERETVSVRA
ncbi:MAG: LacI family transcriptional regulator [Treponema sp. GWB1_62_6]|nr:MAG: LacI family transcriptional regulator [Treponema sp. GWA1_62_8]OHE67770.1 MAG: LacI family transcriptional regulator [Treponema sp. GWC1_61_84]OHE69361.1 MAG: LacI family transcriptional regulator [Treponema sp. GWB1_62_6]OHE75905.1 MAG: LacI family transcriptional regulator [Treponema sp. RIFOXYC1_FULL_61_9]HCM25954.1 LacI family transcriptional regulator [Treponema sp.]